MRITGVEATVLRLPEVTERCDGTQDTLLVRVRTDAGIEGIGEVDSSPEVARAAIDAPMSHAIARGLAGSVIGMDPLAPAAVWLRMYQASGYFGRGGAAMHAMSGIDMALWDVAGKAAGRPACELLGGRLHDRLRAYASTLFPEAPEQTGALAARLASEGYTAVKFGWGPFGREEAMDVGLTAAARRGLGEHVELMVDAGQAFGRRAALRRAQRLEEYRLSWLEEPLDPEDLEGYRWLCDRSPIPIAAGEQECTHAAFERLIDAGVDVVQPDVARAGGLTGALAIGRLAERRRRLLVNHSYKTGISIAASLHLLAALPGARILEYCVEQSPLRRRLTRQQFPVENGYVRVPDGPGLGVDVDEEVVQQYRVD